MGGAEPGHGGGAQAGRGVAGQVVQAERGRQPLAGRVARDDDLLEGEEGAGLAGADGEVSRHGRGDDHPGLPGEQEDERGQDDEPGLRHEGRLGSPPLGGPADHEGHGGAGEQSQRDGDPELARVQPQLAEVDRQQHAERAIAKGPGALRGEDEAGVTPHGRPGSRRAWRPLAVRTRAMPRHRPSAGASRGRGRDRHEPWRGCPASSRRPSIHQLFQAGLDGGAGGR